MYKIVTSNILLSTFTIFKYTSNFFSNLSCKFAVQEFNFRLHACNVKITQIPEALILCSLFIHEHKEDHNDLENLTIVVSTNQEAKSLHNMNSFAIDIIHTIPWAEGVANGMQISVLSVIFRLFLDIWRENFMT